MERKTWGTLGTQQIELFTLKLGGGLEAQISNFGAALVGVLAPDHQGQLADVVLGYDSFDGYKHCTSSLGVMVGRHANRIEGAQFSLHGRQYQLAANDGKNHLHGGPLGFGKVVWTPKVIQTAHGEGLELHYFSPHGEEGYPGNLKVKVTYGPTGNQGLRMDYWAKGDQDTVVNLTNHTYFNLAGQGQGVILDHELEIYADFFTPINGECVPTGEIYKVEGTPLDFRNKTMIGERINADHDQIKAGLGYDHNWILRRQGKGLEKAARVEHTPTGRVLEVWTTKPGVQFYSGNFLNEGVIGKGGVPYVKRSGFCLETQFFPNSLRFPHFPSAILPAEAIYEHSTIYQFSVLK